MSERRTQAQRRAETTAKLLDATVGVLVEAGYAGCTTTAICRRAGVSQGALFRYWPTKGALLAAAAEHLLGQVVAAYEDELSPGASIEDAIRTLWDVYQRPELQAALELYVASRTDPEVADALAAFEPRHRAQLHAVARRILPPAIVDHPEAESLVELALASVQGASIAHGVTVDPDGSRDRLLATLVRVGAALAGE